VAVVAVLLGSNDGTSALPVLVDGDAQPVSNAPARTAPTDSSGHTKGSERLRVHVIFCFGRS
jgi:hypothetical protein